nr:hypothetical protein [Tanacetum cinerariifolium]
MIPRLVIILEGDMCTFGLNDGIDVVEVVVKWNGGGMGGIYEEIMVKGGRRLSCTFCAFWIAASKLWENSWKLVHVDNGFNGVIVHQILMRSRRGFTG